VFGLTGMNSSEREGERGFLIFVFTIVTSEKKIREELLVFYLLLATLFLIFYKKRREEVICSSYIKQFHKKIIMSIIPNTFSVF
jgi:hypothetical protein